MDVLKTGGSYARATLCSMFVIYIVEGERVWHGFCIVFLQCFVVR